MSKSTTPIEPDIDSLLTVSPRDKQSVRTTFKLSQEALDIKTKLAGRMQITQKEVTDLVVKVLAALPNAYLKSLLADFGPIEDPVRKTHVLSRGALQIIEEKAEELSVSRDEVFDVSILYLKDAVASKEEKRRKQLEEALEIISDFGTQAAEVQDTLQQVLHRNDPVELAFDHIIIRIESLEHALRAEIEDGVPVDPSAL